MKEPAADPQDELIKTILASASIGAILAFVTVFLVVAAMVSANWNFMNWME